MMKTLLMACVGICAAVCCAGKMEDYGGFKARNYAKDDPNVKNYLADLTDVQRQEYIEATRMAASGYPDYRHDYFKTTGYKEIGSYDEAGKGLYDIVAKAKELNPETTLRVYKEHIREYDDRGKPHDTDGDSAETRMYTITGKDSDRLSARVFEKVVGGKKTIGVVFCGTDWGTKGKQTGDVRDDIKQLLHIMPTPLAYKEAAELLEVIKTMNPDTDINVYGHSEGGGEATYSVLSVGVQNGSGKIKCYGVNSAGLNGLKTNNVINPSLDSTSIADNFTLIQNNGEWCSPVGYQFGQVIQIPDMGLSFTNGANQVKETDHQHGVEETLWKMEHIPTVRQDGRQTEGGSERESGGSVPMQTATGNDDPFDAPPETNPSSDGAGATSTGGRPSSLPSSQRRNGGSIRGGGGNTSCRF